MTGLVGSASSIPQVTLAHAAETQVPRPRGGEAEPTRPLSRDLTLAIAKAHRAWALMYAPHLLEEWN